MSILIVIDKDLASCSIGSFSVCKVEENAFQTLGTIDKKPYKISLFS